MTNPRTFPMYLATFMKSDARFDRCQDEGSSGQTEIGTDRFHAVIDLVRN